MKATKRPATFASHVGGLFVLGILLLIIGAGVMVAAWPSTSYVPGYESLGIEPSYSESGSGFGVFIGAVMAGVGQILVAVAIIACGVRIGVDTYRAATPTA